MANYMNEAMHTVINLFWHDLMGVANYTENQIKMKYIKLRCSSEMKAQFMEFHFHLNGLKLNFNTERKIEIPNRYY